MPTEHPDLLPNMGLSIPSLSKNDIIRFWSLVDKSNIDGCWPWRSLSGSKFYGTFYINGVSRASHRISYYLETGIDPVGSLVCHRCDNPPCVRPDHLFMGTTSTNVADKIKKGRHSNTNQWLTAIRERRRAKRES